MDDATFWDIIDRARGENAGPETSSALPDDLERILEKKSDEEVAWFGRRFYEELIQLNRWSIWAAGYVIEEGMSGDSFHYFRSWLIGKGHTAVERAMSDPDGLGEFVDDPEEIDNELLAYVAVEVLQKRGGEDPRNDVEDSPDDEPTGEPFDEETVYDAYPRLAAQFA